MHKHSYKEQEKHRREQEILQKASQLLIERGYSDLNMDELADMVGISKPTLYQHFKSKEDLVSQVIIHSFSAMEEHFAQTVKGTPIEQLKQVFQWIVQRRFGHQNVFASSETDALWMAMRNNPILAQHRARAFEGLNDLVEAAKAQGQLAQHIPTRMITQSMFCLVNVFKDPQLKNELFGTEEQRDSAVEALWEVFLNGVNAKSDNPDVTASVTERKV